MATLVYEPPPTVKEFILKLREVLDYDPATGIFIWRKRSRALGWEVVAGGKTTKKEYLVISVDRKKYLAHRLAWLLMTGDWPSSLVDHRNTDGTDNRWCNLRAANKQQNACNTRAHADGTSGVKGVTWNGRAQKWQAQVCHEGKQHYLGVFSDKQQASQLVEAKRNELHGEYARTT